MQVPPVDGVNGYNDIPQQGRFDEETSAHAIQAEWARQPGPQLQQGGGDQYGGQGQSGQQAAGGNPAAQGWMEVCQDRMKRMQEATDPALKAHYQAELDVMKPTMDALGLQTPDKQGGGGGAGGGGAAGGGAASGRGGAGQAGGPSDPISDGKGNGVAQQYISNLMKDFGLTKEQATGIVANLFHESWGMNANITQGGALGAPNGNMADDNANGYGIAQWGGVRKQGLINFAKSNGLDPGSHDANYGFLKQELSGEYSSVISALKGARSVDEATQIFSLQYLKPSDPQMEKRLAIASQMA